MTMPMPGTTAAVTGLADEEQTVFSYLMERHGEQLYDLELLDAYYNGNQVIAGLGISVPPQLNRLHTVIGWPALAVDALDERLDVEGFRYEGSTEVDTELSDIWQANNMDEEHSLAHIDALALRCSYIAVGASDSGIPLITVESPMDLAVIWNPQIRHVTAAVRPWEIGQEQMATLYLPNVTITLTYTGDRWQVEERDEHGLGLPPIVRMANRPRAHDRAGRSEISQAVMSITDAACRTLLGLEVAREFYGAPQRYILGASESAFQDAEGNPKSAWETYIGRVLALERDEDGNVPTVGQFTPYNPAVYTDIVGMYSRIMASITGLPPQFLGEVTANPASADAIRSSESRLNKRAERRQTSFESAWEEVMRLALRIANDGSLPVNAHKLETVWAPVATPTPAATTDSLVKQVQVGIIPADSDITREKAGYTAVEREILKIDTARTEGARNLTALVSRITQQTAPDDSADDN